MAKVTKDQKHKWHQRMRQRACDCSGGVCAICDKSTSAEQGVIHHLSYPSGVYERDVEELIKNGICLWLCKPCHLEIHLTDDIEKSGSGKLNAGKCHLCGEICFGGWERAKTMGIDECICRQCYRAKKRIEAKMNNGQMSFL